MKIGRRILIVAFIVVIILFIGCSSSPQDKLIKETEAFLKSSLNDPASYQPESIIITDTVTKLQFEKETLIIKINYTELRLDGSEDMLSSEKSMKDLLYRLGKSEDSDLTIKKYQNEIDSINLVLDMLNQRNDSLNIITVDNTEIKLIHLVANYRAKNGFGALVKTSSRMTYDNEKKTFQVYSNE